ncbi:hypothetical protein QCN07_09465 [Enterobacter hormaechei]|uniref:hypothetical protein n=1 Tax=Enterobacter hormaechei TaxID=158836 RepID=UPI000791B279|nr:Uncharacterised protein [Enterobacter hormaechei]
MLKMPSMIGRKNLPQREFVKVKKLVDQKRSLRQTLMVLLKQILMETEYIKEDMLLLKECLIIQVME